MMKKKKFKFAVELELVELSSVPLVNAVLFGKVRLLDGGNLSQLSSREAVQDHMVHWGQKFKFNCRMSASATTGVLEPCLCKISVRKELKGGKSYMKCGFVHVNLAEFAGSGTTTRRYLLEGYETGNRQDNSILKVSIEMTLLSGDPLFKAPDVKPLSLPGEGSNDPLGLSTLRAEGEASRGGGSALSNVGAGSSGRSSGPKNRTNLLTSGLVMPAEPEQTTPPLDESFEQTHSRTSSYNSQQSKGSGYCSTNSNTSSNPEKSSSATSLTEQTSDGPKRDSWRGTAERRRKHAEEAQKARRVEDTRVDADEVIEGLMSGQDFTQGSQESSDPGLQLFIAKDGSTALGSNNLKDRMSAGTFQQVVIDKT